MLHKDFMFLLKITSCVYFYLLFDDLEIATLNKKKNMYCNSNVNFDYITKQYRYLFHADCHGNRY